MRLQRYLLAELLSSFLLIALIVTAIFFAAMMLQFLHNYSQLSLLSVLKATPYIIPLAFPITLPVSFLIACLLTFGRFTDENEFLAMQMGGIHPWHAAAPAFVVGAVLTVATVKLNTDVIPFATLAKKAVARGEIRELLRAVDDPNVFELEGLGDLRMSWRGRDERGLKDVLLSWTIERDGPGGTKIEEPHDARAGHCRIDVAKLDEDLLVLDMDDFETQVKDGASTTFLREDRRQIALSLLELSGVPPELKDKGIDEMSGAQIWYRVRRLRETLSPTTPQSTSASNLDYLRRLEASYWKRIALGLAPLAFAFVGAALGLAGGRGNRMTAFLTAIVVALPIYYPLLLWGETLARSAALPAALATNLGNIVLAAGGLIKLGRVFR